MMKMHTSRLINAAFIASVAVLAPTAVFAQDVTTTMADNSSGAIGGLVIWLLGIGGLFAVGAGIVSDKKAQSTRSGITTRR